MSGEHFGCGKLEEMIMDERVTLQYGDGGKGMGSLISEIFYSAFKTPEKYRHRDGANLTLSDKRIVFTTDSYVISPIFFKGGDIGKLSVCGTLNDLAVSGARPLYLSAGFIIEEGFKIESLKRIVLSMAEVIKDSDIQIVTGDTKVVPKGNLDGLFINTSGIGMLLSDYNEKQIQIGDEILVTGTVGEHGAAIALERYNMNAWGDILSDCGSVYPIVESLIEYFPYIKLMKDPTRGGIGTVLNEVAKNNGLSIELFEESIPISNEVKGVCQLVGFDPLYLACEGRVVIIVQLGKGEEIVERIRKTDRGAGGQMIGKVVDKSNGIVYLKTKIGGKRILPILDLPMLPRIC